jgi:hypothetical protein
LLTRNELDSLIPRKQPEESADEAENEWTTVRPISAYRDADPESEHSFQFAPATLQDLRFNTGRLAAQSNTFSALNRRETQSERYPPFNNRRRFGGEEEEVDEVDFFNEREQPSMNGDDIDSSSSEESEDDDDEDSEDPWAEIQKDREIRGIVFGDGNIEVGR